MTEDNHPPDLPELWRVIAVGAAIAVLWILVWLSLSAQ